MKRILVLSIGASSLVSALVTLAITAVVSPRLAEAQAPPTVLTAQRFELQDADRKIRAAFGLDATGRPGLTGSSGLILFDRDGETRLRLALDGDGNPSVTLHDVDFTRRVTLAANPQAGAVVLVRDPGIGGEGFQPVRVRLAARNDGTAHVGLYEPPGETPVWVVP